MRPIALANCLLKVVSHTLLLRLESAIEEGKILPPNFFAYRKGRCSVEMGMSLLQTLNSAHHKKVSLAGVQIDLEGAFENCSRVYLRDLLELMGLGPTFLRWIDCLWVGMSGRISYGGIEQEPIEMTQGLTQGAPESATLFNLANIPLNLVLLNLECDQFYPIEHELPHELSNSNRLQTYSDDSCTVVDGTPGSITDYI